jgi:hypothetical protein
MLTMSRLLQCFGWGLVFIVFVIITVQDVRRGRVIHWPKYLLYNLDRVLALFISGLFGYLMVVYQTAPANMEYSVILNLLIGVSMVCTAWQMASRSIRTPPEIRPTPHNQGIIHTVDETPLLQYIRSRWSPDELLAALAQLDPGMLRRADRLLASGEAHKSN